MKKRLIACLLAAATLCGAVSAVSVPASAAQASVGFTDITDPAMAEAAEVLRLMGVVNGTGGSRFNPSGTLTRAEFCKMAVEIMGRGKDAAAQANRTIFRDVRGTHWASGYINLAASIPVGESGNKLMMGKGNGTFAPGEVITYAQVVTVLMRILGYSDADVASATTWYAGYLSTADAIGLTSGITLAPAATITRGQTAVLLENMLYTQPKDGTQPYLTSLGGAVREAVVLALDPSAGTVTATTDTGVTTYKTDHASFPSSLEGAQARIAFDKGGKVLSIRALDSGSHRTVTAAGAEATYLIAAGGEQINIPRTAIAYRSGQATTYGDMYMDIRSGSQVSIYYTAGGQLEYVFLHQPSAVESAMVAKSTSSANPFAALVGSDTGYRILKNGVTASLSDIRQYDVATYDKGTKTLRISDLRLTGIYQNVSPSPVTPLQVTVLGATFPVLSSAYDDFASFKIGDTITLLLTSDGQVAGAVTPSAARSTAVGVVTECTTTSATVRPLMDLNDVDGKRVVFTGSVSYSASGAAQMKGQMVTVSSSRLGELTLSRVSNSSATGTLDINKRTLGGTALSDNVFLYERIGTGAPVAISWGQLTRATIPASKISYVAKDYAGKVNVIVLDDVTGDQYAYGLAKLGTVSGGYGELSYTNTAISVSNGGSGAGPYISGAGAKDGDFIGIAPALDELDGHNKLAGWVALKSVSNVSRAAFSITSVSDGTAAPIGTVTTSDMVLPIAGNVCCYNRTTKTWFASLDEARAYSNTLTIYYDRSPEEGGKVRVVVVG